MFNIDREGENCEPTAMEGLRRDNYQIGNEDENESGNENENEDDADGFAFCAKESSPFMEIPNNAARYSARNTPRKFMTETNTFVDSGNGFEDANGRATTTNGGGFDFGMDTIPEIESDFGSHTPTGAPAQGLGETLLQKNEQSAECDNINTTLSETDSPREDGAEMHHTFRDLRKEVHETEVNHEGDTTSLSTFSAVPHTEMAKVGQLMSQSATKRNLGTSTSPNKKIKHTSHDYADDGNDDTSPTSSLGYGIRDETSPLSNRERLPTGQNSSVNLLCFTPQRSREATVEGHTDMPGSKRRSRFPSMSPTKNGSSSRSPSKLFSLIDHDMPALTPMSRSTITPRELESVKSSYMSQITALQAALSGRDAEVDSLKGAVSEAEKRVGDALDQLRSESARREALEAEQAELERRAMQKEKILANLKCDMEESTRQKESMTRKMEEMEREKIELEQKVETVESQLASKTSESADNGGTVDTAKAEGVASGMFTEEQVEKKVQDSVEEVAKDLHKLYKEKHETKVTALKKSYAARWEKRVKEAEDKVKELTTENGRLKADKPATTSTAQNTEPTTAADDSTSLSHQNQELQERIDKLEHTLTALKSSYEELKAQLEAERVEKGELVAAVDEWLALQQDEVTTSSPDSKRQRSEREREEEEEEEEGEQRKEGEKEGEGRGQMENNEERKETKNQRELPEPKRRKSTPTTSEDDDGQTVRKTQCESPRVSKQHRATSARSSHAQSRLESQHRPQFQAASAAGRSPAASRIARFAPSDASASNSGVGGGGGGNSSKSSSIARARHFAGPMPRAAKFGLQGPAAACASGTGRNGSNGSSSSSTSRVAGPYTKSNLSNSGSGIMGSIERMGMGGRSRGGNSNQSSHANGK
ncbi:hypothetical protein KEM54_006211 [Ascosphaera aggregata]|nr:hypothetical protein KEM54_006211 [Ascosphaera aggregata]